MTPNQVIQRSVTISSNVFNEMSGEGLNFNFSLVKNIFAEDSNALARDMLWVFSVPEQSTRVLRMILCLKHHGTEFKVKCKDRPSEKMYALRVVKELAKYYDFI